MSARDNNSDNKQKSNIIKKSTSLHFMNADETTTSAASFIINENDLEISNDILGSGHFGIVKKAVWITPAKAKVNVAVKILRENLLTESKQTLNDFLNEISFMCSLNNKNLTKLHGIVLTTQTKSIMMVTELAPSSLLNYIKSNNKNILLTSLHSYSYQIASGMEYLESKKLIHMDLAARNILLFSADKVKICDFGLMKRLSEKNDYVEIEPNSMIPYSWYPPESLKKRIFSVKSDVWSYATVLWEIFTFGERPWLNLTSSQILEKIENNERLKRPDHCSTKVYSILIECWAYECSRRPSFQTISKLIREAYPAEMKAKQNFNEPNRLAIKQGDTVTIIDGHASKYWWFGQNNRTFCYGHFPRAYLDPQRKLNTEDISLPLKHSFIHTGHCSGNANEIWGHHDHIDEIFLKNPLNPADLGDNLENDRRKNDSISVKLNNENNFLIDFNDNNKSTRMSILSQDLESVYYSNEAAGNQVQSNLVYENNKNKDEESIQFKQKSAPLRPPPPQSITKPNDTNTSVFLKPNQNIPIATTTTAQSNKEFKKHEFNKTNKIDFDDFLSKVMNDVLLDLSKNNNTKQSANERIQNQKNPFFYSQQTLLQASSSRLPPPPPPLPINHNNSNRKLLIYENCGEQSNSLYENESTHKVYF